MINVYIVSGFLGSGKTTFIQKLLTEKKFEKVMLLENEFGEVGVDGSFFEEGLNVREINNGCICCSLKGDFASALEEIEKMGVTDLIIEPSGVGKLSDIIPVVQEDEDFRIVSHICIVDAKTCKKYHKNFKEYFDDQVVSANAIILSHLDVVDEEKKAEAIALVKEINDEAHITDKALSEYTVAELLDIIVAGGEICEECCCHHHHHDDEDEECCCGHHHHHDDDEECCCGHHHHDDDDDEECECHHHHHHDDEDEEEHEHHHHHHDHDEDDEHEHHHHHHHHHHDDDDEDEPFKNVVFYPEHVFSEEELGNILSTMSEDIIRVKGYVHGEKGMLYFNYILNEYNIFPGKERKEALVSVIGTVLDRKALKEAFHG